MPPKNKSKNAPNQHDKRHERGLAKAVLKKHSNGDLNGQPNGKPASSAPTSPLSSTGLNHVSKFLRSADPDSPAETSLDHAAAPESTERGRNWSDASYDELGQCGDMADVYQESISIAPNGEAPPSGFKRNYQASGTFDSISTLLALYPLRDAISILILLLSLPPTLVLVIQTLFASLTFVPPTASIALFTLPNVKEMFNSSNFGYPALATILIVDLIFWVCWLPVWKPLQNVFLDLSQAVVAVSLSGAAESTDGPTYSIATCTVVVGIVHVLRYKAIHLTALDYLRSVLHKMDIGLHVDVPSFATHFTFIQPVERGWIYTVIRTILGIHIISQGVTQCIRRKLVKANEQSAKVPAITKSDVESTATSEPTAASSSALAEGVQHHNNATQSTDGRPPGPPPSHRDSKPRESINKKKRKQANEVRSQQPLWAAVASTKVSVVKDSEQRAAYDDAREASRMDTNSNHASGNLNQTTNRIWISEVRDTEIFFNVELCTPAASETVEGTEGDKNVSSGIDKSKPFYVRINGATWSSTRITMRPKVDDFSGPSEHYDGEIFGLASLSSYNCEIVGMNSNKMFCSANIITRPAQTTEQTTTTSLHSTHQTLRPLSPITTLKQSIQQAESKLNDTRNRSKKSKKDQRAVHSDIKREINLLKSKLDSSGVDDKQEKRLAQINNHKNQAEEAAAELKVQIDALGDIPQNDVVEAEEKRRNWQAASDAKSAANRDLEKAKNEADRELSLLKAEISQAESKHEKLVARLNQRSQEVESLVAKQQANMTAKQRRDSERAQTLQRREDEEGQLRFHTAAFENELQNIQQKAQDAYQEIAALHSWSTQPLQPPPYPGYSSPPTPDSMLLSANGSLNSPTSNGFPAFAPQVFPPSLPSAQPSAPNAHATGRGRSSSMLSQYSGFTDNGEEYTFAPDLPRPHYSWPVEGNATAGAVMMDDRRERQGSSSLGSGSTGSNSPRPDARPFVPVGPIGPPSKNKQSPVQTSPGLGTVGSGR